MIRVVILVLAVIGLVYLVRSLLPNPNWQRCRRCDGHGYWRATRGERVTCDACQGTGRLPR